MDILTHDLRYAVRSLRRTPGFSVVAVLTLALAIGGNTAVFSLVRQVLLDPLPFGHPERVMELSTQYAGWGIQHGSVSEPEYYDLKGLDRVFDAVAAYSQVPVDLAAADGAERLRGVSASADLFRVLGVGTARGRVYGADEDLPGRDQVVVLSDGAWRRRYGGDPAVIGRTAVLNAKTYRIIGVMPRGFEFADGELFIPLALSRDDPSGRSAHYLRSVGRLRVGVTLAAARDALVTLSARLNRQYPESYKASMRFSLQGRPLRDALVGDVRPALLLLTAAVGLVLLIACANLANLLLARMRRRQREVATRAALGAPRRRLVRQFLTESALLGVAGGAIGVAIAAWGGHLILSLIPGALPGVDALVIDLRVLGASLALSLGAGILFGLLPALRAGRLDLQSALTTRSGGSEWRRGWTARSLVAAEVALAVMVVSSAGLLLRSLWRLQRVDPGFQAAHVLAMDVTLPEAAYPEPGQVSAYYREAVRRLEALPGVEAAGGVLSLPLRGRTGNVDIEVEGQPVPRGEAARSPNFQVVTPGYIEAMRIPVLRGRALTTQDDERAPLVALVNSTMAARVWPGVDPIGRRFRLASDSALSWVAVVGVVGDVRGSGLEQESRWEYILPHAQAPRSTGSAYFMRGLSLVIRTPGDPAALAPAARRALAGLDPRVAVARLETMPTVVARSTARPRFTAALLGIFGGLATVLAVVGIAGVLLYAVTERTHEIGVRLALGARPGEVGGMVVRDGMLPILVGLGAGLGLALGASRLLRTLLFGVTPLDPTTYVGVAVLLASVAMVACGIPARYATRVDPITALRSE